MTDRSPTSDGRPRRRRHQPTTRRASRGADTGDALAVGDARRASTSAAVYTAADLDGLDFLDTYPGVAAVPARPVPDDVREPAVDDPPVRRVLHRRGLQRLLPPQPGRRPEGPLGGVRPGDPPRLRQRPPTRHRRRRHGRRGDRLDPRHAPAVRRHPARRDERVDDDERRRAPGAGALHPRRRGAGRAAGASSRGRSRTTSSRSSWSATRTSTRRGRRCGSSRTSSPSRRTEMPQFNSISISGYHMQEAGRDGRPRAGLHARRRRRVRARRARRRPRRSTPSRRGCRSSGPSA